MRIPVALAVSLLVAACQTTVRTETRYLPPTDPGQLACVDRCYEADRNCLGGEAPEPRPLPKAPVLSDAEAEAALRDYDECSKRVQAEYEQCQAGARNSSGQRNTCYRPVCVVKGPLPLRADAAASENDAGSCTRTFNACFVRCGGRIESRQLCEGNC